MQAKPSTPPRAIVTALAEHAVHGKVTKGIGSIQTNGWMNGWMEKRCNITLKTHRIQNHSLLHSFCTHPAFIIINVFVSVDSEDGCQVGRKQNPDGFELRR